MSHDGVPSASFLPEALAGLGEQVQAAYQVALDAHRGQTRKGDGGPYINHPVRVAEIVNEVGLGTAAVAAALLHDVVEDSEITIGELSETFGEPVASLVAVMTDRIEIEGWQERKDEHRREVEGAGRTAALIYAADKLSNVHDTRRGYAEHGESIARNLNASLDLRIELWWRDLEMVERVIGRYGPVAELRSELEAFEAERR